MSGGGASGEGADAWSPVAREEARALARERFKARVGAGEKGGGCGCDDDASGNEAGGDRSARRVAGVRFRDSGRTYYFEPGDLELEVGAWVVAETGRGREAGRVEVAPRQVQLALIEGELKPILRLLGDADVRRMDDLRREATGAVRTFGERLRARRVPLKPIAAEYDFDGSRLLLSYALPEREQPPDAQVMGGLVRELDEVFGCRIELRQVGPRDEARLLGGLGRCGRTLCCSSWLPVFPEVSMTMAKTQDLALHPAKVSGVCGRLLCCLSYENEQYKQMKAVMPRLGQAIETPVGPGMVVSMQILKELITVRLARDGTDAVFRSAELGLGPRAGVVAAPLGEDAVAVPRLGEEGAGLEATGGPRRRRRRGRRGGVGAPAAGHVEA